MKVKKSTEKLLQIRSHNIIGQLHEEKGYIRDKVGRYNAGLDACE